LKFSENKKIKPVIVSLRDYKIFTLPSGDAKILWFLTQTTVESYNMFHNGILLPNFDLKPFVTRKSPMVAAIHVERQDCFAPLG
jgi:hypothetical protein